MKRCALLILLFACSAVLCFSQKTAKVSAAYTYYAPETMSVEEAKRVALERAKIQAIADEFGTVVSQSTSTVVTNENGKSDNRFFSTGGSDVKGEWIETIGEPEYNIEFKEHFLVVACTVKGIAREITQAKIDFVAKTLRNGTTLKYESTEFRDGDDMYLHFRTPYSGFLTAYWIDSREKKVYKLLPYRHASEPLINIAANTDYIFFSKEKHNSFMESLVDEFQLTCASGQEHNELCICFSNQQFNIPSTSSEPNGLRVLSIEDFEKWKSNLKRHSNNILIRIYPIAITSKR